MAGAASSLMTERSWGGFFHNNANKETDSKEKINADKKKTNGCAGIDRRIDSHVIVKKKRTGNNPEVLTEQQIETSDEVSIFL